jgi:ATP adenylyltransferase
MTFDELKLFLLKKTRVGRVYQHLLIKALIESGGSATMRQLAVAFLASDEGRLAHCEERLKEVPVKAMSRRGIITRKGDLVTLDVPNLTGRQRAALRELCEQRLREHGADRDIFAGGGPPDADPKLGPLCSGCGRSRKEGPTDFRAVIEDSLDDRCPFCRYSLAGEKPAENELAFVKPDARPVTEGHSLIIPRRHVSDWFNTTRAEQEAMNDLLRARRQQLREADPTIEGFNIGMNSGEIAGQTVFHCHIHLIPRRKGDAGKMRCGVRGMIRDKMSSGE